MYELDLEKVKKKNKFSRNPYKFVSFFSNLECMPARVWICIMMFTATWTSYTCRAQLGSIIPSMLPNNKSLHNNKTRDLWDVTSNTSFPDWDTYVRKYSIMAYGMGQVPGNVLGGIISIGWGSRETIFWSSLLAGVVSILTPVLANWHWGALVGSRVIIGLTGGVIFPACHTMVSQWAPPIEKSRFVWSLLGGTAGTVLTLPALGMLTERVGWEMAWIIPSVVLFLWLIPWLIWAWNSPSQHPFISEAEKEYIDTSRAEMNRAEKLLIREMPLGEIFRSIPFFSLVICHYGNMYLIFFYQNYMITYLQKARGAGIEKSGFMAAAPWLCRFIAGFFFSWSADVIKRKQIMTLTAFRKSATIFSHLIPGVCLMFVGHTEDIFVANLMLSIALACNGAAIVANLSNNQDLSPNYAGFLYGVMNGVGVSSSIIVPIVVEYFIAGYEASVQAWQYVFYTSGGIVILTMMVFILGGSAEQQSWNTPLNQRTPAPT